MSTDGMMHNLQQLVSYLSRYATAVQQYWPAITLGKESWERKAGPYAAAVGSYSMRSRPWAPTTHRLLVLAYLMDWVFDLSTSPRGPSLIPLPHGVEAESSMRSRLWGCNN